MSVQTQAGGQTQDPAGQEQDPQDKKDSVSYETHRQLLNEKKKRDEELRKAREDLAKYDQEKRELEEKALKEKEDYKKLFESREKELAEERARREAIESKIIEAQKYKALNKALGASVPEKFWNLVELDKIAIDPATGMPDEMTTKAYADEFQKNYGEIFVNRNLPRLPNDGPTRGKTGLTYEQWVKLPYAEKKKRQNELID